MGSDRGGTSQDRLLYRHQLGFGFGFGCIFACLFVCLFECSAGARHVLCAFLGLIPCTLQVQHSGGGFLNLIFCLLFKREIPFSFEMPIQLASPSLQRRARSGSEGLGAFHRDGESWPTDRTKGLGISRPPWLNR